MRSFRSATIFSFRAILFFFVSAVVVELVLRYIFLVDSRPVYYQESQSKLLFFDRDFRSEGVHRYGNPPQRGGEWEVNSAGWASHFEYLYPVERQNELIALYGDSYVVGLNVDYWFHQDYLIKEELVVPDVYNFAMGGMMLMQYVKLVEYAEKEYDPDFHVIYLNGGDIRTSLRNYGVYSLYYQLIYADGDFSVVEPVNFSESPLKRMFRNSKLLIYLRYHRGITLLGSGRGRVDPNANNVEGEVISDFSTEDEEILESAARYMFQMISELSGDDPVLLVLDAPRGPIYRGESDIDPFQDCRVVQEVAEEFPSIHCLDLLPVYREAFLFSSRRFNDEDNPHWNEYGNTIVAEAVAKRIRELTGR